MSLEVCNLDAFSYKKYSKYWNNKHQNIPGENVHLVLNLKPQKH